MSTNMSGFRKGFSCQTVLMDFIETCKKYLDDKLYTGAVLTDLSKAFDCLPHCLVIKVSWQRIAWMPILVNFL